MCGSGCGACGIQARRKLPVCSMKLFRHPTVDGTKVQILAVNIDFENKLYILSTLISASPAFTVDQKKEHFKTIEEFRKIANRNMIAHTPIQKPCQRSSVACLLIKALQCGST